MRLADKRKRIDGRGTTQGSKEWIWPKYSMYLHENVIMKPTIVYN